MELSKETVKVLQLAYDHEDVDLEDPNLHFNSPHVAYRWEHLEPLKKLGYITCRSEMMPEGYEVNTYRITPKGQAYIESLKTRKLSQILNELRAWITAAAAVGALIASIIAATK